MQSSWPFYRKNKVPEDPSLALLAFGCYVIEVYQKKSLDLKHKLKNWEINLAAKRRVLDEVRYDQTDHCKSSF